MSISRCSTRSAIGIGIVVVTKVDAVGAERVRAVRDQVETMLAATVLAGSPILAVSSLTGAGVEAVRGAVLVLRDQVRLPDRPATLAIDRVFTAKGRGVVVTGTLRGGPLARGDTLGLIPSDGSRARIREIQVHGSPVERVERGGRTALNLGGVERAALHRGMVLTVDPEVTATDRVLVAFDGVVADRAAGRVHAGTAAVDAVVGRAGRDAISLPDGRVAGIIRLAQPIALRAGDRFVLRRGAPVLPIGGLVLDPLPPRGLSRRRQTPERVGALIDPPAGGAPRPARDPRGRAGERCRGRCRDRGDRGGRRGRDVVGGPDVGRADPATRGHRPTGRGARGSRCRAGPGRCRQSPHP